MAMRYDPDKHHRRSIRLKGYDYSQAGAYFVTLCAQNRACLFGEIAAGNPRLYDAGRMVERWWAELGNRFSSVHTDEYVVMPNHFHGILVLVGADPRVRSVPGVRLVPGTDARDAHAGAPLPEIMQWFKTMTTNEYIRGVKQQGWPAFRGRLWQRNYYERIIRDEDELDGIRRYIADNPSQWESDPENPLVSH